MDGKQITHPRPRLHAFGKRYEKNHSTHTASRLCSALYLCQIATVAFATQTQTRTYTRNTAFYVITYVARIYIFHLQHAESGGGGCGDSSSGRTRTLLKTHLNKFTRFEHSSFIHRLNVFSFHQNKARAWATAIASSLYLSSSS